MRTTWEKLYRAVVTLATADAPLKERLARAFHSHLLDLTPQDVADGGLQIDFESLYVNAETGKVLRTEWLSEEECQQAAQTILHLFVEHSHHRTRGLRGLAEEPPAGRLMNIGCRSSRVGRGDRP